jgi:hypothetical protein
MGTVMTPIDLRTVVFCGSPGVLKRIRNRTCWECTALDLGVGMKTIWTLDNPPEAKRSGVAWWQGFGYGTSYALECLHFEDEGYYREMTAEFYTNLYAAAKRVEHLYDDYVDADMAMYGNYSTLQEQTALSERCSALASEIVEIHRAS